jgi:protein ImuB
VPAGGDAEAISGLPIEALRLPPETIKSLHRLGILTIQDLNSLPRDGLATRLGEQLIRRWDQALGLQPEPIVTLHSLPDWSLEYALEYPTADRATIAELLRRLSVELAERLRRRGEGALRVVCRLDLVQSPPLVMQLGLFRPTHEAAHLALLLEGQLEQQLRPSTAAALWRLSLQATLTAPLRWRQADLFDAGTAANQNAMAKLIDTLSSRLGRKRVLRAKLQREAQPELAFTLQPLTGRRQDGAPETSIKKLSSRLAAARIEPSREDPLRRPPQLFAQPVAVQVADRQPKNAPPPNHPRTNVVYPASSTQPNQLQQPPPPAGSLTSASADGAPGAFQYQSVWYDIVSAWGPERLESGWWRGPSARRDYFRVETSQGSWWWLFRDLSTGAWFLHGKFE